MLRLPLVQPRLLALCARMGLDFVVRAPSSVVHPRRGLRFCRRTIRRCGRARDVREGIDLRTPDLSGLLFLAFALVHWNQGWKSGVAIFCFAAVLHGLVALTNSLLPAMAVHATYDFAAGEQIRRKARAMDLAAGAPAR